MPSKKSVKGEKPGTDKHDQELPEAELEKVTGGAGMDGISYLVAVTQMKANDANEQALEGAEQQRALIKTQKALR